MRRERPLLAIGALSLWGLLTACARLVALTGGRADNDGGVDAGQHDAAFRGEADAALRGRADGSCAADTMVDPENCGACGRDCCGGACVNAVCQASTFAGGQISPAHLLADEDAVYWSSWGGDIVRKAGVNGSVTPIAAGAPSSMALDDTYLYWADYVAGAVYRVPKVGGATLQVVALPGIHSYPYHLPLVAVDQAHLYWTADNDAGVGALRRMPKDGGAVVTLASTVEQSEGLLVDGMNVYFSSAGGIQLIPKDGGLPLRLDQGPLEAVFGSPLSSDDASVTWVEIGGGIIRRLTTGDDALIVFSPGHPVASTALDSTHLYFTSGGGGDAAGAVYRAPDDGGTPFVLAGQQVGAGAIVTTSRYVYWVAEIGPAAAIMCLAK